MTWLIASCSSMPFTRLSGPVGAKVQLVEQSGGGVKIVVNGTIVMVIVALPVIVVVCITE